MHVLYIVVAGLRVVVSACLHEFVACKFVYCLNSRVAFMRMYREDTNAHSRLIANVSTIPSPIHV